MAKPSKPPLKPNLDPGGANNRPPSSNQATKTSRATSEQAPRRSRKQAHVSAQVSPQMSPQKSPAQEKAAAHLEEIIGGLRTGIDAVDDKLLALLSERVSLVRKVAEAKHAAAIDLYYRPEREAMILRRVRAAGKSYGLDEEVMTHLFRELMSACMALEQKIHVAYLGPEGTFTHAAALKHFGAAAPTTACPSINQVFREVESKNFPCGVVPVENSIEGVVNHTLDLLIQSPLRICGEVQLRVHQHLLSRKTELKGVTRVYSHAQSLAQCRGWLDTHLPQAQRVNYASTAEAARRAAAEPGSACVASEAAAELHGLRHLATNIEDNPGNTTRFLVIGNYDCPPSGEDKTSLLFSTPNKPGALYRMLACFAKNGVSMSRIESRPSRRGMWDYFFFVDLEGHREDEQVATALASLRKQAEMIKLLGSYPCALL